MKNKFILAMSLIGLKSQNESPYDNQLLYDFKKMVELVVATQEDVDSSDVFKKVYEELSECDCFKDTDHYYRYRIISQVIEDYEGKQANFNLRRYVRLIFRFNGDASKPANHDLRRHIESIMRNMDLKRYYEDNFNEAMHKILGRISYIEFVENVKSIYDIVSDELSKKGPFSSGATLADRLERRSCIVSRPVCSEEPCVVSAAHSEEPCVGMLVCSL